MDILEFQGQNRWLSNFWPATVELDGIRYPTVENAYQAAKTAPAHREQFIDCSPGTAKRLGKIVAMREDWTRVKVTVMRNLIQQKFAYGTELGERLLSTGTAKIVEGNGWGDTFWGVCCGQGKNWLGVLIMEQRARLFAATP